MQAEGGASDNSSLFASGSGKITGALEFRKDTETFQDVFAFTGELPEVRLLQWRVCVSAAHLRPVLCV